MAARRGKVGGKKHKAKRKGVPSLPTKIQVVLHVPFHIRCVQTSLVAEVNAAPLNRGKFATMLGGVCTTSTNFVAWATSYHIRRITAWPSAGGDAGVYASVSGTAEQALCKEDHKISTMPTGITVDRPVSFRPGKGSYLSFWQATDANPGDTLMFYWGTAGSVWDFEGTFTLPDEVTPYGVSVSSGVAGSAYYLAPDTANNLVPQGLPTTH
jgi:hypothetical protein